MGRAKLTALAVERAHRSGEPVLLSDGDGLYLRKQTRDGASWTLRYHFAGRQHWLTLGNYPDMPLAQARIEARQARVLLDKRQDPLTVRRAALAEERQKESFKSLCEDWYRAEVQARGLKHPAVPRRYLAKDHVIGDGKHQPVAAVTTLDAWLLAYARAPLVAAGRSVARLARRLAFPADGIDVHSAAKQPSEQRNLSVGGKIRGFRLSDTGLGRSRLPPLDPMGVEQRGKALVLRLQRREPILLGHGDSISAASSCTYSP